MGEAFYQVMAGARGWVIAHDGETSGAYDLPEAAFEAAVAAASLAIKERRNVRLTLTFDEPRHAAAPPQTSRAEPSLQREVYDVSADDEQR